MGFEAAPFKLTMVRRLPAAAQPKYLETDPPSSPLQEYVDIMGGIDSPGFAMYKKLFKEGFNAARKHSDEIISTSRRPVAVAGLRLTSFCNPSAIVDLMQFSAYDS